MKAKYISCLYDRYGKYVDLEYEYRGETYFVRKNYSGNAMGESLREQHKEHQKDIDAHIEAKNHPIKIDEWKYEGSALEAFDKFYEMYLE